MNDWDVHGASEVCVDEWAATVVPGGFGFDLWSGARPTQWPSYTFFNFEHGKLGRPNAQGQVFTGHGDKA